MTKHITRSLMKTLQVSSFLVLAGLAAGACTQSTGAGADGVDDISGDDASFEGTGSVQNLTVKERATYKSDWSYVNSLMASNTSVILNHADERQHRFVMARLKMAGKTQANSPELFREIEMTRSQQIAQGLKAGQFAPRAHGELARSTDPGRVPEHYLSSVNLLSSTTMEAVSTGSRIDAITYGYLDAGVWDDNGDPLGDMTYAEVYSNMTFKSVAATGDLTSTSLSKYVGDSMLIESTVSYGYREYYTKGTTSRGPSFSNSVQEPSDHTGDNCYSICLNRSWTNDCDVDLTSTTQALKVPLKGSISLSTASQSAYRLDTAKIAAYKAGTALDSAGAPDPGGSINVVLKSAGGGCAAVGTQFNLSMQAFWNTVTVTNNLAGKPATLSWDMTGAAAATFSQQCRMVQDNIQLDLNIVAPWIFDTNGSSGLTSVAFSNNPSSSASNRLISCMQETNSCLAAGTAIEMADGGMRPIESIHSGDRVFSPFHQGDLSMTISDTAKGFEVVPMVRIEDEQGHNLLMTEMHPIQVVGRGMVMAKYLKTGDVVETKGGPSHLVKVSRESYNGVVHNLKVGSKAETASLGKDQTVVYANGFLVGDGQIQSKYEAAEMQAAAHPARVQVPARWRTDRLSSAHHHH